MAWQRLELCRGAMGGRHRWWTGAAGANGWRFRLARKLAAGCRSSSSRCSPADEGHGEPERPHEMKRRIPQMEIERGPVLEVAFAAGPLNQCTRSVKESLR